jgi:beta-lactamase regulating signal transducer with metallopeptidase domain/uncharacterized protein YnzC (UPF0291/DUF896 family)
MNSWQLLLELTFKALLILAAAGLLTVWLRNTSAALRHTVWSLALGGLLLLPLLTLVVPAWRVAILPAPDCAPNCEAATLSPTPATIDAESLIVPAVALEPTAMVPEADVVAPQVKSETVTVQSLSAIQIAFLIWALGVAFVLARLAFGTLRMWRITREAEFLTDYHWSALTNRLRGELDLRSHISLYASEEIAMPVTWGILRPVIVLPADANEWSAEWRRIVLLHELAHIKRRDCLTQMLANVACALYWFNPLVWFAAQRLRVERELACDDCVLEVGTRASDYASYLVEIAKSFDAHEPATPVTVGMACSQLESRVRAILDPALQRGNLSRSRKAALTLAMACLLLPLAALQATSQVKPEPPAPPVAPVIVGAPETPGVVAPLIEGAPETPGVAGGIITREVAATMATLAQEQKKLAALQDKAAQSKLTATEKEELTRVQVNISAMQDELRGALAMVSPPDPAPAPSPVAAPLPAPYLAPMPSVKGVVEVTPELALVIAAMQDAKQKDNGKEEGLTADNLVRLKMHDVTPEYIEAIKKAGYDDISVRQIVELKTHEVTPEFIKQAQSMSSEKLTAREIVQLKISGLKPEYISAMKQAGYDNLPLRKLTNMRMMGVTPEYGAAMKRAGFENLTADQLTQLKTHDVTEEYIKQVQGWGLGKLSVRDVMEIKIHGVKPEDAQTLKAMGFDNVSLRDLTQVRMFGVTESYVKELRSLGLDNLTLRQVLQLKQHGVDSEYIRKMRAAGFKNISANDLIKMRTQGIDTILLKN